MLSDLTDADFQALKTALELYQRSGAEARPGEMSYERLADWYCTTPQDIRNEELCALEKLRVRLSLHP